jgi:hypothetical protein
MGNDGRRLKVELGTCCDGPYSVSIPWLRCHISISILYPALQSDGLLEHYVSED